MIRTLILRICAIAFALVLPAQAQIKKGYSVQITIQGVPSEEKLRIDGTYPVSESGYVNMPFISQVRAAGVRADQLAKVLESAYKSAEIYRNPTFQVIENYNTGDVEKQMVFVGGQTVRPGPVPYTRELTVYQAIQAAGGATPFGSMKRVKLFRGGNQKQYNLSESRFMHIPLEPGDTIEVPQKDWLGN